MKRLSSILSLGLAFRTSKSPINALRFYSDHLSSPKRRPGPLTQYRTLVEQQKLQHDPYQEKVALQLDNLLTRLEQYEKDMEEYHVNLAKWEERRENERRRLLLDEAETKQKGGVVSSVQAQQKGYFNRWFSRKKPINAEPGVGKWVSYLNRERKLDSVVGRPPMAPPAPKGLYVYGNVGSGKTMLMDMFYSATEGIVKHRRRFHFHEAMLEINDHMHKIWKNQVQDKSTQSRIATWIMNLPFDTKVKEWVAAEETYKQDVQMKNILPAVADKFLVDQRGDQRGSSILCFDEIQGSEFSHFYNKEDFALPGELEPFAKKASFMAAIDYIISENSDVFMPSHGGNMGHALQTVDVFAIVALSGIISRLLSTGTVLVATSNRQPGDLNQDGMQWDLFLKFLNKLEEHCEIVLIGSEIDYRRLIAKRSIDQITYFWPLESTAIKGFDNMWDEITKKYGGQITSGTVPVMFGRTLEVPESCNGVARFTFEYLCGRPLGAADYIAVAKNHHTVFISDIPVMSMRIRDKARRFITLIDELYNYHCCLYCSAAASIEDLFQGTEEGTLFDLESFQFETETEGAKLRRDVLAEGNVSSGGAPTGIISLLSGKEEMFAFRRAVSRLIEMQTPFYQEGVHHIHPFFQTQQSRPENNCTNVSSL